MSFLFSKEYHQVRKNGMSQGQEMVAYLGGSAFQTVCDSPLTSYRQLVQQYAKDASGKMVDPKTAVQEANSVFKKNPVAASFSGLTPRLLGVGVKRIPKFGILLGYSYIMGEDGQIGVGAATAASILSAPIINVPRYLEKQARNRLRTTGKEVPMLEILRDTRAENFRPLFRGTIPLMGHSLASALLGLAGQPILTKKIKKKLGENQLGESASNLLASAVVSPIYVFITNPISRLEVIQQTSAIKGKPISTINAIKEMGKDMSSFGIRGVFRGQGVGLAKAIVSLSLFHEGRLFLTRQFKSRNEKLGLIPK